MNEKLFFWIIVLWIFFSIIYVFFWPRRSIADDEELVITIQEMQQSDPLFNKIAYCESRDNPKARNPFSTAKGRFQFLDSTWKRYGKLLWGDEWVDKDVMSYKDNTDLAWFVYTNFGTKDWEADPISYECWKSEIPNAIYIYKK